MGVSALGSRELQGISHSSSSTWTLLSPSEHKAATKGTKQWATKSFQATVSHVKGPGLSFATHHQPLCQSQQLHLCVHTVLGWQGHSPLPHTSCRSSSLGGRQCCYSSGSLRAALLPTACCPCGSSPWLKRGGAASHA